VWGEVCGEGESGGTCADGAFASAGHESSGQAIVSDTYAQGEETEAAAAVGAQQAYWRWLWGGVREEDSVSRSRVRVSLL